jgi:hypothetical protein
LQTETTSILKLYDHKIFQYHWTKTLQFPLFFCGMVTCYFLYIRLRTVSQFYLAITFQCFCYLHQSLNQGKCLPCFWVPYNYERYERVQRWVSSPHLIIIRCVWCTGDWISAARVQDTALIPHTSISLT